MLHSYPGHHSRSVATRAALIGLVSLLLAACDEQHSAPPAPPAMVGASGNARGRPEGQVDIEG
ncbi:MAG: hypothetical protein ACK5DL_13900, partial [Burkholderiales bacterium]